MNYKAAGREWSVMVLCAMGSVPAFAQSLDQQYEFFLRTDSVHCRNLGFARTNEEFPQILPGQAGPNLFALCTGGTGQQQLPDGSRSTAINGGGTGAMVARGEVIDRSALRRRQEDARAKADGRESDFQPAADNAPATLGNLTMGAFGVFASLDYKKEQQDKTFYEGDSDASRFTLTIGGDYRPASTIVMGVALKSEKSTAEFQSGGGTDSTSLGFSVYGSWLKSDGLFFDANAGMDSRRLETTRIVGRQEIFLETGQTTPVITFRPGYAPAFGQTDIIGFNAEIQSGYDFSVGRFDVGPRIGMTWRNAAVDAYVETGPTAMTLAFDDQNEDSLVTSVGARIAGAVTLAGTVCVPQLDIRWLHEFNNDQRQITARFAEDLRATPVRFGFFNQPPDRDVYTARLSTVVVFQDGLSAFATFEKLFAHDYRDQFGVSVGVRWEL